MIANIKAIMELIKIVLEVLNFLDGGISEIKFMTKVNKRKKMHDLFKTAERKKRLEILRSIN